MMFKIHLVQIYDDSQIYLRWVLIIFLPCLVCNTSKCVQKICTQKYSKINKKLITNNNYSMQQLLTRKTSLEHC